MRYVAVLPWVYEPYARACLEACKLTDLLVVDNHETNRGVMRSHNLGLDMMRDLDAGWLVVLSAAVRFGPAGGLDFIERLEEYADHLVVNVEGTFGWHCIAFRRDLIEAVGRWDENFYPYAYDDVDLSIRHHRSFPDGPYRQVQADVTDTTMAHSLELGGVKTDGHRLLAYLTDKWGAPHGQAFADYYDRPWNDATNPLGFWPPTRGARWDGPAPEDWRSCEVIRPVLHN